MKVFISWSGPRSQVVAEALRDWLPLVLHYVEPWLSRADLAAGERWADAVAKQLESTNFGIICVTRENVAAPWILFEAGSLAKSLQESRVVPLLLDLEFSEITGPLAQFQAKKVDKDGLSELVHSINAVAAPQEFPKRARASYLRHSGLSSRLRSWRFPNRSQVLKLRVAHNMRSSKSSFQPYAHSMAASGASKNFLVP